MLLDLLSFDFDEIHLIVIGDYFHFNEPVCDLSMLRITSCEY